MLQSHHAFDEAAGQYDAWYDSPTGRTLWAMELACLRPLLARFPQPYLEVGVGTGRFAAGLNIAYGVDPSLPSLKYARRRGLQVIAGVGEQLPLKGERFGGALVAFTLCFVQEPHEVLQELHRVLVQGGGLVLGVLLAGTPWADWYTRRGRAGHPTYRGARFLAKEEVETLLQSAGFSILAYRSTLLQAPGMAAYEEEQPVDGYLPHAGFVGIAAAKQP